VGVLRRACHQPEDGGRQDAARTDRDRRSSFLLPAGLAGPARRARAAHAVSGSGPDRAVTYPTVEHAYWALRTTDVAVRQAVLAGANPFGLARVGGAPPREGWDASLQAIILQLLRAKFQQHEALAQELIATGEGRIEFHAPGFGDGYVHDSRRHLIGRLLEVVRAELRAGRAGLLDLGSLT
jgi:predicted NAD-dependent protein-ADP-ribosyltransferase YbiA (DUF1768 family)